MRRYGSLKDAIGAISTAEGAVFYVRELCDRADEREYKRFGRVQGRVRQSDIDDELTGIGKLLILQGHLSAMFVKSSPKQRSNGTGEECGIDDLLVSALQIGMSLEEAESLTLAELSSMADAYARIMNPKKDKWSEDYSKDINVKGIMRG